MNVESGDDESAREVSDGTDEDEAAEEALHKFIREYDREEFIRQKTKKRRVVVSNLWKSGWFVENINFLFMIQLITGALQTTTS